MPNIIVPGQQSNVINLVDPYSLTGELEAVAIEDVGDQRIYHYGQTTGYITNHNEQMRKENPDWDRKRDMRQVASVPMIVWQLWESAGITGDQRELRKALERHALEYKTVDKRLI